MNILVDVSHPAHVHFFRFAIKMWEDRGHKVKITSRDKDVTQALLEVYGFEHKVLSKMGKGVIGLAVELVQHETKLSKVVKNFEADIILEIGGSFIVHAGKLLGVPTCVFTDTEHATISNAITFPFATYICTPDCYKNNLGDKHVRYKGYQELAYLHPNYFKPSSEVLTDYSLNEEEPFFIVRFVSWGASHDLGQSGLQFDNKRKLIQELSKFGRVIITSEGTLPAEFMPYKMKANPTKIHDLLYFATLYIGEGATMASEAAILGTPSIFTSTLSLGYLDELSEKYQLVHLFSDGASAIEKAISIVSDPKSKSVYKTRCQQMLNDKEDVTGWIVKFIESLK